MTSTKFDDLAASIVARVRAVESPHGAKIAFQIKNEGKLTAAHQQALLLIVPQYMHLIRTLNAIEWDTSLSTLDAAVEALNAYLTVLRTAGNDVFVRQADFKTSLIPEFLMMCFRRLIELVSLDLAVSGQRNVAIEMMFDPRQSRPVVLKKQRVDVAIIRKVSVVVDGEPVPDFCIPIVAVECKTNFDKNMIGGVEHSVTSLKRTFPECLYIATAEWSDFDMLAQNYASTDIDEIYLLRAQRRSEYRRSKVATDIQAGVARMLLTTILKHLVILDEPKANLKVRMRSGTLIGGLATPTEKA